MRLESWGARGPRQAPDSTSPRRGALGPSVSSVSGGCDEILGDGGELMLCPGDAPKGTQRRTRPQDPCGVGRWHHGRRAEPSPYRHRSVDQVTTCMCLEGTDEDARKKWGDRKSVV